MDAAKAHPEVGGDNTLLLRIARHLIMQASFISDLGLYHGKMGIVIFFAHYARYTGEPLYDEFAGELLDEIYDELHAGLPVNFESGLCGIGWGFEYLLNNGFLTGDSDEILSEMDTLVMERDLRRISDLSLRTGLEGIAYYICTRIDSPSRKSGNSPFDADYLADFKTAASHLSIPDEKAILNAVIHTLPEAEDITSWKLGLENGCAGVGLKRIWL